MSTFLFPDVNVWVAWLSEVHPHHAIASDWARSVQAGSVLFFCRQTQLGLLRLLTNRSVMGEDVLTQAEAWMKYDQIALSNNLAFVDEPATLEEVFRGHTSRDEVSTKQWADGYLAAFAFVSSLNLVTFDKALAKRVPGSILLQAERQIH